MIRGYHIISTELITGIPTNWAILGIQEDASLPPYPNQSHRTQPLYRATGWLWPEF